MTFTISAWEKTATGYRARTMTGPLPRGLIVGWDDEDIARHGKRKYHKSRSSTCLPETAGRGEVPSLGNLLHAGMCGK